MNDWSADVELPRRWRGRDRFVILEAGGDGIESLLPLHRAWRDDASRCARLHVIVVDAALPDSVPPAAAGDAAEPFRQALARAWPPRTPNLHRLSFDDGAFVVLLVPYALDAAFSELVAQVDAFHLTGTAMPSTMDPRAMKAVARLAAPAAVLVADSLRGDLRAGLVTAGFRFSNEAPRFDNGGAPTSRAMARFEPRDSAGFAHRSPRSHAVSQPMQSSAASAATRLSDQDTASPLPGPTNRHALVIGAGLAGCATAWALAECGWRSTVIDAHHVLAAEASGNPAGIFHGICNRQDGRHARFNRAAALEATKAVRIAIASHGVNGAIEGVLRVGDGEADVSEMCAAIAALALPPRYIEALDANAMSEAAGLALDHAGWCYREGGWVDPVGLARSFVARAGAAATLRHGLKVASLRRAGTAWQLLDAGGRVIDESDTVVLANAYDALRLIETIDAPATALRVPPSTATGDATKAPEAPSGTSASSLAGTIGWPISRVRGQLSVMPSTAWPNGRGPRRPLTGAGYAVDLGDGRVMFGATADADDDDAQVREADHLKNLRRVEVWLPGALEMSAASLQGRTAWRCVAADRLPVIGAVPALNLEQRKAREQPAGTMKRLDQPRFVPREPGLFIFTALGSRGITWAALGAETLAALVTGGPCPVEASLLDATDPARFVSRLARRHALDSASREARQALNSLA